MKRQVSGQLEVPEMVDAATPMGLDLAEGTPLVDRYLVEPQTSRVDLIFYRVDHAGQSYEAHVFVSDDATTDTPHDLEHGYVGSFTVFGHGGCYGDVDHCDIDQGTHDEYDVRPPHPLTPWTKTLIVPPEAIDLFVDDTVQLSVVPVAFDGSELEVEFKSVRLAAYAT
ncbi:MAG: hypothetical protein WKF65_10545 [Gaiellaceae bacterium]